MSICRVFGCCNPMGERYIPVTDDFIALTGLGFGSNVLPLEEFLEVEEKIEKFEIETGAKISDYYAGGSGSNIIAGLSGLGIPSWFLGGIGNDILGTFLEAEMRDDFGVHPLLVSKDAPTCEIYTLINPEGNRIFAVYLGAAHLEPDDITQEAIDALKNSDYFVLTGYKVIDSPEATSKLIEIARANNVKIVFDLSCGLHIAQGKDLFYSILEDKVHILLANEEETEALYGVPWEKKPDEAKLDIYQNITQENYFPFTDFLAIHKLRHNGAIFVARDGTIFRSPAFNVNVVNDNGAGDGFLIGTLYGIIQGYGLNKIGRFGNYGGGAVISQELPRRKFKVEEFQRIASADVTTLNLHP